MKRFLFCFILIFIVLTGCGPAQESQLVVENPSAIQMVTPTRAIAPSITSIMTDRPKSTEEPTATATIGITATGTSVPTVTPDFSKAKIYGSEDRGTYFLVIIEVPNVQSDYDVRINNQDYVCNTQAEIVDRLYCSGPKLRYNENYNIEFFSKEMTKKTALFSSSIYFPEQYKTPLPLGDPSTWCPLRGQNIYCETEHRVEDGEECWVSTCSDACGYYYSYHTCQYPPDNNFLTP